jgi:hypothetical protein
MRFVNASRISILELEFHTQKVFFHSWHGLSFMAVVLLSEREHEFSNVSKPSVSKLVRFF